MNLAPLFFERIKFCDRIKKEIKEDVMEIKWFGHAFFLIKVKDNNQEIKIAIDPFSSEIGIKPPKIGADILLITHSHYDHNNTAAIEGDYFLIDTPGEYEAKKVFIKGILSYHDNEKGKERGFNTIYVVEPEQEGIRICHLGDLGQKELTSEQIEEIGEVDVLMIPVGGIYTINAQQARDVVSQIEPKIVIPMHYSIPKLKIKLEGVEKFLKAMGVSGIEAQTKLSIKKEKLPAETQVVLFKPPK